MAYLPTDVANQALDACGVEMTLGDIEEGTREAQVCLRAYRECLQQLLRGAHWDFARKQAAMQLLADATGQTPNVGTQVVTPWIYEYQYPIDCMKARFVPWNPVAINPPIPSGNITPPNPNLPLTGAAFPINPGARLRPARFLVGTDFNYPPAPGQATWEVQGVSPAGRTVVLTNAPMAQLVYTAYMAYPSVWDSQFRAALVAFLAAEVALPLSKDKKLGLAMRQQNLLILKDRLANARVSNGNEGFSSADISVDWMRARRSGGAWGDVWGQGPGAGVFGYGWDSCGAWDTLGNSSAF